MATEEENKAALGKLNYILMVVGVLIVVVGFVLMSGGGSADPTEFNEEELFHPTRITVAPITVIVGYVVVIFAIMKRPKSK